MADQPPAFHKKPPQLPLEEGQPDKQSAKGVYIFGRPLPVIFLQMAGILLCYTILAEVLFGRVCIIQIVCGYPCPGCGMLHAAYYFLTGRFSLAMASNPTLPLWIALGLWALVIWWKQKAFGPLFKKALYAVALIMIAVYILRMIFVFPQWPMNVYSDNLLFRTGLLIRSLFGSGS